MTVEIGIRVEQGKKVGHLGKKTEDMTVQT